MARRELREGNGGGNERFTVAEKSSGGLAAAIAELPFYRGALFRGLISARRGVPHQ